MSEGEYQMKRGDALCPKCSSEGVHRLVLQKEEGTDTSLCREDENRTSAPMSECECVLSGADVSVLFTLSFQLFTDILGLKLP